VALKQENNAILLIVEDDGLGMPPTSSQEDHYGLIGMRERAIMIGANLHVISNPEKGTKIVMEYNYNQAPHHGYTQQCSQSLNVRRLEDF